MYIFTDEQYKELKQLQNELEKKPCDCEYIKSELKKILRIDSDWQTSAINYIKSSLYKEEKKDETIQSSK